jgi:hypothetical protein
LKLLCPRGGSEFRYELTSLMPVVPHGLSGVDCAGCIVAVVEGGTVGLHCKLCGAVVGVVQVGIMEGLLGLDCGHEDREQDNAG